MREFTFKKINEMSARDFFCIERLRINSFVVEQKITEEELDMQDLTATHVYLLNEDKTLALATCRLFKDKEHGWMFGRVCVDKHSRGLHLGQKMMESVHKYLQEHGIKQVMCHAQLQAKGFYQKLGYEASGDVFEEAGIKHILMVKKLG